MKITGVETRTLDISGEAGGYAFQRDHSVVLVRTDEGLTGISRTGPGNIPVIEDLTPILLDQSPLDVERLWHAMYATTQSRGHPDSRLVGAIGALDIALWDLKGQALDQPVWRLLGGSRQRIPSYADGTIFERETADLVQRLADYRDQGFTQVKFHTLNNDPVEVLSEIAAVRAAVGEDTQLMVDAHRAWDPWTAAAVAQECQQYNVYWLEEPVQWDDQVEGLAVVARAAPHLLVAGGEGERTLYAARDLVARGSVRVLQHDILGGGGYTAWRKYAAVAEAFHVKVAPHGASFPELNAHLVAAVPNGLTVSTCPACEPYQIWSRLYEQPMDVRDGWITLSDRPGLGLTLDEDFISHHQR